MFSLNTLQNHFVEGGMYESVCMNCVTSIKSMTNIFRVFCRVYKAHSHGYSLNKTALFMQLTPFAAIYITLEIFEKCPLLIGTECSQILPGHVLVQLSLRKAPNYIRAYPRQNWNTLFFSLASSYHLNCALLKALLHCHENTELKYADGKQVICSFFRGVFILPGQ